MALFEITHKNVNTGNFWVAELDFDTLAEAEAYASRRSSARLKIVMVMRTEKMTDAEFDALERNEDGRIVADFDEAYIWMTDAQRERLHGDDWSRGEDLQEELRIMMAEFA